jgi:hypothetical protein
MGRLLTLNKVNKTKQWRRVIRKRGIAGSFAAGRIAGLSSPRESDS